MITQGSNRNRIMPVRRRRSPEQARPERKVQSPRRRSASPPAKISAKAKATAAKPTKAPSVGRYLAVSLVAVLLIALGWKAIGTLAQTTSKEVRRVRLPRLTPSRSASHAFAQVANIIAGLKWRHLVGISTAGFFAQLVDGSLGMGCVQAMGEVSHPF
jgi:hypothetical protein